MKTDNELLQKIDDLRKRINSLRPLSGETAASLKEYYKIGLTWSSNAIEGNTLTESETKVVIEDGLTIGGKPLRDHLEAKGHADAFERMIALANGKQIVEEDIVELHTLFYKKSTTRKRAHIGKARCSSRDRGMLCPVLKKCRFS